MNKKWACGFVFICLVTLGAGFQAGREFKNARLNEASTNTALNSIYWESIASQREDAITLQREELEACRNRPPETIIQVVEVPVEVEKLVELQNWDSEAELVSFLEGDMTDMATFYSMVTYGLDDGACEHYAEMLIKAAAKKGKKLSFEVINRSDYARYYMGRDGITQMLPLGCMHMACSALVEDDDGKHFYFIEPQTDRLWLIGSFD